MHIDDLIITNVYLTLRCADNRNMDGRMYLSVGIVVEQRVLAARRAYKYLLMLCLWLCTRGLNANFFSCTPPSEVYDASALHARVWQYNNIIEGEVRHVKVPYEFVRKFIIARPRDALLISNI